MMSRGLESLGIGVPFQFPISRSVSYTVTFGTVVAVLGFSWRLYVKKSKVGIGYLMHNIIPSSTEHLQENDTDLRSEDAEEYFKHAFHDISNELIDDLKIYELKELVEKHMKRMLEYNIPGGKLNRGRTVANSALLVNQYLKGRNLRDLEREEFLKRVSALGWCIEWLQASFLVADDLMDASITRRGKPCWYKVSDIGIVAVNDMFILLTQTRVILRKYFGDDPELYMHLDRVITETVYQTELGQFLDLSTQPPQGPIDLQKYTEERHRMIVEYKTAYYSFYAPIALGMLCGGVRDAGIFEVAKRICVKMGIYFQIQDDYLDCYGSEEQIGKIGTDIQDGKCSWLVVEALKLASESQKKVLKENYGRNSEECIAAVKAVYNELNLQDCYNAYETTVYDELQRMIEKEVYGVPKRIYSVILSKIYKRGK